MKRKMPAQLLLQLTQTVTVENSISCVCIPDRSSAEYELEKIKRRHGKALISAKIRKNHPGPSSTYVVNYKVRETRTERLY